MDEFQKPTNIEYVELQFGPAQGEIETIYVTSDNLSHVMDKYGAVFIAHCLWSKALQSCQS